MQGREFQATFVSYVYDVIGPGNSKCHKVHWGKNLRQTIFSSQVRQTLVGFSWIQLGQETLAATFGYHLQKELALLAIHVIFY